MLDFLRHPLLSRWFALACVCLGGCASSGDNTPSASRLMKALHPYKIDIIQGNVVTREQLAVLQPGLSREQVRTVLGTSLLTSVFHADRWHYMFTMRRAGEEAISRKVIVYFKDNVLEKVEADELPSETEFAATLKTEGKLGKLPALEASEAQLKEFPAPATPAAEPPAAAQTPAATYPSLEPPRK